MKNLIYAILFSTVFSPVLAKEGEWYGVISFSSNPNLPGYSCETDRLGRVISEPILLPGKHEGIKWSLTYQFLNWAYEKEKSNLDLIAGETKINFRRIYLGKSPEEAKDKATRAGEYSGVTGACELSGTNSYTIKVLKGFKFQVGDVNAIIGGEERKNLLKNYLNSK